MGRSPCCDKVGVKKGPWTVDEDQKLLAYIEEHGHGSWRSLPLNAGLQRCGKSCRLRWTNYLRPDIKRGPFSIQEEQTIIQLHALLGNRWSAIASHLPRRTDNEIKNYWNTHVKKRLTRMGIDPTTHKPRNHDILGLGYGQPNDKDVAKLSHMAQWENARLQAEARLVRESRIAAYRNAQASTSILKPSKNISAVSNVGLSHHESSFITGRSYPTSAEEEAKGLMENSVGNFHYVTETPNDQFNCFTDFLRFPGCMEGFADLTTEAYSDHIWGSF